LAIGWLQYAGVAMPVLVFVITKVYESLKNRCDEKRRLKNTLSYYLSLLNEITNPIDRQAKVIEKFVLEQLKNLCVSRFRLANVTSLNTDEIMSLNSHDLFKSMITEKKEESKKYQDEIHHYMMLKSNVRLVSGLKKELEVRFNELISRSNVHLTQIEIHMEGIEREIKQCLLSGNPEDSSREYIKRLRYLQIRTNEINAACVDFDVIQNEYLQPLISLSDDYLGKSLVASNILPHARRCDSHINDLRMVTKQHRVEFRCIARNLKRSSRQITESVAYFAPHT